MHAPFETLLGPVFDESPSVDRVAKRYGGLVKEVVETPGRGKDDDDIRNKANDDDAPIGEAGVEKADPDASCDTVEDQAVDKVDTEGVLRKGGTRER